MRLERLPEVAIAGAVAVCCGLHVIAVAAFGVAAGAGLLAIGLGVAALAAFGFAGVALARYLRGRIGRHASACEGAQGGSPGRATTQEVSQP